jgi:acetate kinase
MAVGSLVLVVNPGSASKKYALYKGKSLIVSAHFEFVSRKVSYGVVSKGITFTEKTELASLSDTSSVFLALLRQHNFLKPEQEIAAIGIRIVAPTSYFLQHRFLDPVAIKKLESLVTRAPLHIAATLAEIVELKRTLPEVPIFGVSDSAFHANKPDYAWNYGIALELADKHEIKRFGYHGTSVESIVQTLSKERLLEEKLIVCHLGSGASVTAVKSGVSIDNSMGYSPLEGLLMATRSGSIDVAAANEVKKQLGINDDELEKVLNQKSGLLGVSGFSNDIRELLVAEKDGNYRAKLALDMYVYAVQKAIGQMSAALGGVDTLVFTGTVGARSAVVRERVVKNLEFLNLTIHEKANDVAYEPEYPTKISPRTRLKNIFVITTDESFEIAWRTTQALND